MPKDVVSAVSGFKAELPPRRPLYCPAGLDCIVPYSLAVTPDRAQAVAENFGVAPAQGSEVKVPSRPTAAGATGSGVGRFIVISNSVSGLVFESAVDDAVPDLRDSFLKLLQLQGATHPFAVVRFAALDHWATDGEYERILSGDYPRRDTDRTASVGDEMRNAAKAYQDSWNRSADPLIGAVRGVANGAVDAGTRLFEQMDAAVNAKFRLLLSVLDAEDRSALGRIIEKWRDRLSAGNDPVEES